MEFNTYITINLCKYSKLNYSKNIYRSYSRHKLFYNKYLPVISKNADNISWCSCSSQLKHDSRMHEYIRLQALRDQMQKTNRANNEQTLNVFLSAMKMS